MPEEIITRETYSGGTIYRKYGRKVVNGVPTLRLLEDHWPGCFDSTLAVTEEVTEAAVDHWEFMQRGKAEFLKGVSDGRRVEGST